jgi:hypothetical protein
MGGKSDMRVLANGICGYSSAFRISEGFMRNLDKTLPSAAIAFTFLTTCMGSGASGTPEDLISPQNYEARRESSSHEDLYKNGDARSIDIGETLVLGELEGPGMITHIWNTVGSVDPFYSQSLVLRIYWDGAEEPSVEAPLGDFFGVGHGAWSEFVSEPVAVSAVGRSRNCFWRMPFRKSAKVTVTNESKVYRTDSFYYYLDWRKYDELREDTPYLHARYNQATPARPGDYTILETTGTGHYVGTVYSALQTESGWFGEGDDRFFIDGEEFPSLRGTGTEDYFGDAWGLRKFSTPYYGVSLWEGYYPGDRVTAYRWHIQDPIPFKKSLKVSFEHRGSVFSDTGQHLGQFNERPDWISSVAYWYQNPPIGFSERIPEAADRLAPYRVLSAADLTVSAIPSEALKKEGPAISFTPGSGTGTIDLQFNLDRSGRYQVNGLIYHSVYGGVYQAFLAGTPLGAPMDLCYSGHDPIWTRFDLHDLEAGTHTLRFEGRGDSPNKRSMTVPTNLFSMVYLILLRLEDVEGYHAVLNEKLSVPAESK